MMQFLIFSCFVKVRLNSVALNINNIKYKYLKIYLTYFCDIFCDFRNEFKISYHKILRTFLHSYQEVILENRWYNIYINRQPEIRDLFSNISVNNPSTVYIYLLKQYVVSFLGAFTKLRKATIALSCLSVCPHGITRLPLETDFHKILYLSIFRKSVETFPLSLKSDKNNGYFTWRLI